MALDRNMSHQKFHNVIFFPHLLNIILVRAYLKHTASKQSEKFVLL